MLIGYNTNGFAHHRVEDAVEILTSIGYRSVAVTLEQCFLDPPNRSGVDSVVSRLMKLRECYDVALTIETGSRFLLDPRRKHQPTLLSAAEVDRSRRREFLVAAIEIASAVDASCVSFWSGTPDKADNADVLWKRLEDELRVLLNCAKAKNVRLGLEPEPGMFIETMAQFRRLHDAMDHPLLGLTLDVGHIHCLSDGDVSTHIETWRGKLFNVHIEDMRRGKHEHLMFGDGDMDFPPIFEALSSMNYAGPIHVELSRHSHDAVRTAKQAYEFFEGHLNATL